MLQKHHLGTGPPHFLHYDGHQILPEELQRQDPRESNTIQKRMSLHAENKELDEKEDAGKNRKKKIPRKR